MDQLLNQDGIPLFPRGSYFIPSDEDLLFYLKKKINGEPVPYEFIPSTNVYKNDPQELTETYPSLGRNDWYFYTPRDRKYLNGNRPNRATGTGYWKATAAGKPIYDSNNVCIGSKRSLIFYEGNSTKGKKTSWLMQEYMITESLVQHKATNDMLLDKCVLCRIYKNSRRYTKVEEDLTTISCQIEEHENNKFSESENQGQQTPNLQGQQDIDLLVQQPNYLMMQQPNFSRPTDQIGGPLPYTFGSTSDNTDQIYNMENLENIFLVDPEPDTAQSNDNFTLYTLMDSFGPSAYDMDDIWEELSNEKNQFSGRKEQI